MPMKPNDQNLGKAVYDAHLNHSRISGELKFWIFILFIVISGIASYFIAREEFFSSQIRLILAYYSLFSAFIAFALTGIRLSMRFQIKPDDANQLLGTSRIKNFLDFFE